MTEPIRRIVIVDDNADDRRLLVRHLSRDPVHAYEIVEASNGAEGIDAVERIAPDIVILDQHLGESTGTEVLMTMRERGFAHIPVVFLTGSEGRIEPPAAPLELGADDFLSKDEVSGRYLRRAIDNAIVKAKTRFELERSRTELAAALEEVTQRMEFERRLIGVVSHDLRDPLSAMTVAVETLKRGDLPPSSHRVLAILERTTAHMSAMVTQLLDVTRVRQDGAYPVRFEEVDLEALVDERVDSLRAANDGTTIELVTEIEGAVEADATSLRRALDNLVGNAVRHGDPTRPITVRVVEREGFAEISVANAGDPIPADRLTSLFEPFTKGARSHRDGLGLGLYITREIIAAHGGTIEVASGDAQTRFTLRVPLRRA